MTPRRTGRERSAATLPPAGLPGWDPQFSRIVHTADAATAAPVGWHILDTGNLLAEAGVEPIGTVMCVHGNPTWSYLWRDVASLSVRRALAGFPAWRVIAPDHLEMGFSERTGTLRRLRDRVTDLAALTDELQIHGPVVTLGHDWGGVVALGWAVDHPRDLAAVISLNTALHQPEGERIPALLRLALAPAVLDLSTRVTPAFLESTLALASPRLTREVADAYRGAYRTAARRRGIRDFVADIPVDDRHPSFAELTRIADAVTGLHVRSLLLWGPADPIFGDRYLDDLVDRMPSADVHRFEGASHLIAEDVEIAAPIFDWLDALPAAPASASGSEPAAVAADDREESDAGVEYGIATTSGQRRTLWSQLDARIDDSDVAVTEMAPPGGGPPRAISWHLLATRVREIAAGLADLGVRPGDRVSLLVPPGADLTAALYACLRVGAVVVVADAGLGVRGLTRAVRGARPDYVIGALRGLTAARALGWPGTRISTSTLPAGHRRALGVTASLAQLARRGRGRAAPPQPAADADAAILFTSGSTGPAKGVRYRHSGLEALRDVLAARYDVGPGTGLVAGFAPFALLGPALGTRTVTPDMDVTAPRTLTARALVDAVRAVDAAVIFLSPAAVQGVVATAADLDSGDRESLAAVTLMLSAGAPIPAELLDRAAHLLPGASVHTPYGMTEGLLLTDIDLTGIHAAGTGMPSRLPGDLAALTGGGVCVGAPIPGVEVRIAALEPDGSAQDHASATPGTTGEIVVSAAHLKAGYDRLFLTDRIAARGSESIGGPGIWHRTGDVGHLDAEGRLWVEGRMPHVVVTADGPVTPVAAELRIGALAGVGRVALAGVGPAGTAQLVAVVETVPAAPASALADPDLADRVRTAAALPLAAVLVVTTLPTDIRHNSKIERTRVSRWAEGVLSGARMTAP